MYETVQISVTAFFLHVKQKSPYFTENTNLSATPEMQSLVTNENLMAVPMSTPTKSSFSHFLYFLQRQKKSDNHYFEDLKMLGKNIHTEP